MSLKQISSSMVVLSGALATFTTLGVPANAQSSGEVAVVSWGGNYQEAQRKAFFAPFAKATGIRVVEGVGPQIDRTRAEVASGKPGFDLVVTNQSFNLIGVEQGLWAPIDYAKFDRRILDAIPDEYRQKFGVGSIVYSEGITYNRTAFPAGKPQPSGYKDFWNVSTFPGKRAMPWCDVATFPLPEAALLADGVAAKDLYPIDVPRAVRKLKEIAPNVVWWRDINQAGQLLATGEASVAIAATGRVQTLIDGGAPLKIDWQDARYTFDVWYVLKGAPNLDNAMRFIAFASTPAAQADMARNSGNAPTNKESFALLDDVTARKMPTFPENLEKQFKKDETWWKENRASWVEACKAGLI